MFAGPAPVSISPIQVRLGVAWSREHHARTPVSDFRVEEPNQP